MRDTDRLHVFEAGDPSGDPLVLLHGFGGHGQSWQPVIDLLSTCCRILAFDLPGHAGSLSYPGFGSPRFAAFAILDELEKRGISRAHVAGHSMGGAIAVLMALEAPQRIASLTLVAPGGFGPEMDQDSLSAFAVAITEAELTAALIPMMGSGAVSDTALVRKLHEVRAVPGQQAALSHIISRISRDAGQGTLPLHNLEHGSFPAKLLWGSKDRIVPASQVKNSPKWFEQEIISGAGHMLLDEAPVIVARAILEQVKSGVQTI